MRRLKVSLLLVGTVAVLVGLLWIGQGTGWFPYPSTSFMIDQSPWIWRGVVLAVVGFAGVVVSRRV